MKIVIVSRKILSYKFSNLRLPCSNWRVVGSIYNSRPFHESKVLHKPAPPDIVLPDYGKYYEPSFFETMIASFADSSVVQTMESFLIHTQEFTGLPWWITIILCTVSLRTAITMPLFIWQSNKLMKYRMVAPVLQKIAEQLSKEGDEEAKKRNWDKKTRDIHVLHSFMKHKDKLMKQHKIPGTFRRYLLPWVQLPIWISMSVALRHLTASIPVIGPVSPTLLHVYSSLTYGGALWFSNLCVPDSLVILPILAGISNLAIIEVHKGDGKQPMTLGIKVLMNFVRVVSILLIPIGFYMPSGVVLYWVSSSTFGLTQALVMQSAKVRRFFCIPVPTNYSKTPYRDILRRLKLLR